LLWDYVYQVPGNLKKTGIQNHLKPEIMKQLYTIAVIIAINISAIAQAPLKMSYQCVVRNTSGALVTNQSIGVKISILQDTPEGPVVYQELFTPNPETNANGLLSIEIGTGLPITGIFSSINWAEGPYYLKTEIDPIGTTNYTIEGTSQLLSVPYAFYSGIAGEPADNSVTSAKIADSTIVTADLADNSVTAAKIADGSVTSAKVAGEAITASNLADNSVTSAKIADGTIVAADLANGSVTSEIIADGTIATADLANNSVTSAKISGSGANTDNVLQYSGTSVVWDYAPGSIIRYTYLNADCHLLINFTGTFQRIGNIGTVFKVDPGSRLEVSYYGRVSVEDVTTTGAYFEMRVDDVATTNGRANIHVKKNETGPYGVPAFFTAVFSGLSAGNHTISMWVRAQGTGTGTYASYNPGCWLGDYMIVREIK
jgi:hypothetical protein